jgi:hypothetical protein
MPPRFAEKFSVGLLDKKAELLPDDGVNTRKVSVAKHLQASWSSLPQERQSYFNARQRSTLLEDDIRLKRPCWPSTLWQVDHHSTRSVQIAVRFPHPTLKLGCNTLEILTLKLAHFVRHHNLAQIARTSVSSILSLKRTHWRQTSSSDDRPNSLVDD